MINAVTANKAKASLKTQPLWDEERIGPFKTVDELWAYLGEEPDEKKRRRIAEVYGDVELGPFASVAEAREFLDEIPNAETYRAMAETYRDENMAGPFDTLDELWEYLNA